MLKFFVQAGVEFIRWPYLFFFWFLRGWKLEAPLPDVPKMIVAASPHTTNWDYAHFLAAAASFRRRPLVTVKDSLTKGPVGWFVKLFGGIGIDRTRSTNAVSKMADIIKERDRVVFVFTPDGTRRYRPHWRTGFYYAAVEAGVPIVLAYIDYPRKCVGFSQPIWPTGDLVADFEIIKDFYKSHGAALYPDQANPVELPPYERRTESTAESTGEANAEQPDTVPPNQGGLSNNGRDTVHE